MLLGKPKMGFFKEFVNEAFTCPDDKGRIAYVDLLKGICIFMVIFAHTNTLGLVGFEISEAFRMPMFFFLSGVFFSTYDSHTTFFMKKFNNLLVPVAFWMIVAYVISYLVSRYVVHTTPMPIWWGFGKLRGLFLNESLWFLICLFVTNALFYGLRRFIRMHYLLVAVLLMALTGHAMRHFHIQLPLWVDSACTAIPFFYLGFLMRRANFLNVPASRHTKALHILVGLGLLCVAYAIYVVFDNPYIHLYSNGTNVSTPLAYLNALLLIFGLFFICKAVKWLPIISYFGRYSIVVVCINEIIVNNFILILIPHYTGYAPGPVGKILILAISCLIAIPLCRRFLPWFVAGKPFLPIKKRIA